MDARTASQSLAEIDRRIVVGTQAGLPLARRPYAAVAETLGLTEDMVIARLQAMLADGRIRRVGAIPNHYALGFTANGMSVWDVEDDALESVGLKVGAVDFVSHAYARPRALPLWPYNLFAMAHGHSREEVVAKVDHLAALIGPVARRHEVLFSTRILKKTGLRLNA